MPTLETAAATAQPRTGRGIAWFALLLALLAFGGTGYSFYQAPHLAAPEPADDSRVLALESQLQDLQTQLRSTRAANEGLEAQALASASETQGALRALEQEYGRRLDALQAAQNSARERLAEYTATDRSDWLLAESEYLLRLANQRLIMASDVRSAEALLDSADDILQELDEPELHAVRAAIATDLAQLRALPQVDVQGIWLRLQALTGQVDELVLFELPVRERSEPVYKPDASLGERLQQGFHAALEKISGYLVIRRRDTPYEPLMGPQWEKLVRQNLRMLLEQSRAALLSGNQALYEQSLDNTRFWLAEFFSFNSTAVKALDRELADLRAQQVSVDLPDISASLMAMKSVVNSRHLEQDADPDAGFHGGMAKGHQHVTGLCLDNTHQADPQ